MTTTSPIMICPLVDLGTLPDRDRDVLRSFFTEQVRGIDQANDTRWRRFARDLFHAAPGEAFQLYRAENRVGPFHRRHRVILQRLFEAQERYPNIDALHDFLKLKTWFVDWSDAGKPVPRSTAFDVCCEDDMRAFHARVIDLLHVPSIQRQLFPQVPARLRAEMVDAVLADPKEIHQ